MTEQDNIFLFFSRTYENDVNKKILDDRNFVIPRERLLSYIRALITIPYSTFISFLKENPLGPITSRNITQCSSFAACEIELCQGMLALNNPGLTNTDVGHLFPKYVTSRTDTAFVKYGENQAKTGMQLGLTFEYFGYWYLSCIGYVYADLSKEEKLSWLARALLRDELYSRLVCDSMVQSINLLDYMECLSSDSTKIRRYGCVEYLTSLCLQECDRNFIEHYTIKDSLKSLKKKLRTGGVEANLKFFYGELADDNPHLPINVKRRFSSIRPLTLEKFKPVCIQPILGHHIPNHRDLFIHNLSNIPYLSYSDEKDLLGKAEKGDDAARDAIIESVLPYVPDLIKPFLENGIEKDDLIQEANYAIVDAFYSFCANRANVRFMTYALMYAKTYIKNKIPSYCPIHIPNEPYRYAHKIRQICDSFYKQNGLELSIDELAEMLDFPIDKLSDLFCSLDLNKPLLVNLCPISSLADYSIEDAPADVGNFVSLYPSPFKTLFREDCNKEIYKALGQLTPREADILIQFFGLGCSAMGADEIGIKLGLTRERTRQIKEKAIRRLNSSPLSRILKTYLGYNCGFLSYLPTDVLQAEESTEGDNYASIGSNRYTTRSNSDNVDYVSTYGMEKDEFEIWIAYVKTHPIKIVRDLYIEGNREMSSRQKFSVSSPQIIGHIVPSLPKTIESEKVASQTLFVKPFDRRIYSLNYSQQKRLKNLYKYGKSFQDIAKVLNKSEDCVRYYIDFLHLEERFGSARKKGLDRKVEQQPITPIQQTYSLKTSSKYPAKTGHPWSPEDDEKLRLLVTKGMSVDELATIFERTDRGVYYHMQQIGLITKDQNPYESSTK